MQEKQLGAGGEGFDHADVHKSSGRVFVAHTATGRIEVIDVERSVHLKTISGSPGASEFYVLRNKIFSDFLYNNRRN